MKNRTRKEKVEMETKNSHTPLCDGAKEDGHIKTFGWEYFTRQLERSLTSRITIIGDAVADVFDQLKKGAWTDDHGHPVNTNAAMLRLKIVMASEIEIRANVGACDSSELNSANAQIVALRGALEDLLNDVERYGSTHPNQVRRNARLALSSPAPDVVPREDAEALAMAIEHSVFFDGNSPMYRALDLFRAKHTKKENP